MFFVFFLKNTCSICVLKHLFCLHFNTNIVKYIRQKNKTKKGKKMSPHNKKKDPPLSSFNFNSLTSTKNIKDILEEEGQKKTDWPILICDFCKVLNTRIHPGRITPRGFILTVFLMCEEIRGNCQEYKCGESIMPKSFIRKNRNERVRLVNEILEFVHFLITKFDNEKFVQSATDQFDFFIKNFKKSSI